MQIRLEESILKETSYEKSELIHGSVRLSKGLFVTGMVDKKGLVRDWMEGIEMTKAEILKREILKQYKSIRQFAIDMEIPYSTLVTALERGIEGMAYGTVIKMCDKLRLNPVDFSYLEQETVLGVQLLENRVMQNYLKLNSLGRDKVLGLMEDIALLEKYRA